MYKKGFQFSFGWLFAVLVGAFILFLALYATVQLVGVLKFQQNTERGQQLGILLYPASTGFASAKTTTITLPQETMLHNTCRIEGKFGAQLISSSIKSGIGSEWGEPGARSSFYNKYLFSSSTVYAAKNFYAISKPFHYPFKIADIIILWSDSERYCFTGALMPEEVENEIESLNPENIELDAGGGCSSITTTKVCFGSGTDCDVTVDVSSKTVTKGTEW